MEVLFSKLEMKKEKKHEAEAVVLKEQSPTD
jgi:hypothetical protein